MPQVGQQSLTTSTKPVWALEEAQGEGEKPDVFQVINSLSNLVEI